jgi:hypothetical protein
MVNAIEFAVRDFAGGAQHGSVAGDGQGNFIQVGSGDSVSLNLSQSSVVAYEQSGQDLVIKLVDGRTVVLSNYFNEAPGDVNHLYLSSEGQIVEVMVDEGANGVLFADYGPVQGWDKWSPLDDLRFTEADGVSQMVVASNEPAGMAPFIPGLLGLGGMGTAAAVAGGAAVIGGGLGGGGGSKSRATPTVDPQEPITITTNTTGPHLPVSGTGQPGDKVLVTVGTKTQEATIGTDGKWKVDFPATGLPADGNHTASVVVTRTDRNTTTTLTGPNFVLDLTPPEVNVERGTKSVGDVENLAEYQNGVSIDGKGEAGAKIEVKIGEHTQTTTVAANGTWTVTFTQTQVAAGEYEIPVKITATDTLGNKTVVNETLVVDTVPHPITFDSVTSDNKVSFTESQSGLVVTGTSTAGATMEITLQGVKQTATVGADGKWSVTYATGTLPGGEYTATLTAKTTDAAGNASTATHSFQVDTQTNVGFTGTVATDGTVNAAEAAGGVVLTGTGQAGSAVSVAWGSSTLSSTVGADGTWSVAFPASAIAGGTYASTATVTATDSFGNTATATQAIKVDTEMTVAVNAGQVGGDNIVSASEAAGGIALTGTAEAGASVSVTFEGVTRQVFAGANGAWTANFAAGEVRSGTYASTVSVIAKDAAGNTASTTHILNVDTEVKPFARTSLETGTDTIVNAAEAAGGMTVGGNVEPGSVVVVKFGNGAEHRADVSTNGTWTLTIPANEIPAGENSVTLTAVATDRVGNTSTVTEQVAVDTIVRNFARAGGAIAGDGVVNAIEAAQGLDFTGTAEAHSAIVVRLASGAMVNTTSDANGNWSAHFSSAQVPRGTLNSSVTVEATDRAGNKASFTDTFAIDTVAPGAPEVTGVNKSTAGTLRGIYTEESTDSYAFHEVKANGTTATVGESHSSAGAETEFAFSRGVPDGSYLVVNTQDAAHNESSTLLIVNNTNAPVVDLNRAGLATFDLSAIDLTVAPQAQLSITEAQLKAITGPDHNLIIKGGADDTVSLIGGMDTGTTKVVNGQSYSLYTLGAGASVLVDDDISTSTPVI